jgi:hypothetical protein
MKSNSIVGSLALRRLSSVALAFAAIMALGKAAPAQAAPPREAVAGTLQAQGKLHCHRTLRATGWVNTAADSGRFKREADQDPSDQFLCGLRHEGYATIWGNTGVQPVAGPGRNGLSSLQMTTTTSGGSSGAVMFLETGGLQPTPNGRIGVRFYKHVNSSDACTGRKFVQIGPFISGWPAPPSASGGVTWQGGGDVPGLSQLAFKDKWWRWEIYYDSFPESTSLTAYWKNISDNGPEFTHVFSGWPLPASAYVSGAQHWIHEYFGEGTQAGTCTVQWMNLLVAKNLGPNERIPPAMEVEGNVPAPAPAPAPSPTVDTTPPAIQIISPVSGSIVKTR